MCAYYCPVLSRLKIRNLLTFLRKLFVVNEFTSDGSTLIRFHLLRWLNARNVGAIAMYLQHGKSTLTLAIAEEYNSYNAVLEGRVALPWDLQLSL